MSHNAKGNSDHKVLGEIKRIIKERPTYGYRRITALLRLKYNINHKRVYRIMKENNLLLQKHNPRPTRTHTGRIITLNSDVRWCTDSFKIQCWNGDYLEVAFSLDCHDREVISWIASEKGISGEMVRDLMSETVENRFNSTETSHTVQWLSDNGPGYTARKTVIFGRSLGLEICTTAPYSPESNGMAEAFVKTFKRDYVYVNDISSSDSVKSQLAKWFYDYNENAPHKGLGMMSPRLYRRKKLAS